MPIDFQRVQSVFQAVAELPPAERAALLERECGGDAELRRGVEALLQAHDDSRELPTADPERTGAPVPDVELGQVFGGRYKLRQRLGEGGMGVVFVADQIEPVQRRVALKIVRTCRDTHRLLARFEQERQALALMDHPNIAKVFDGGLDPAGRPYFVMELVKGLPLTRYCDDTRLSPRERLELFIPVCQAVQHAHQKGVIHRDLKPSNILVGLYDGRPVPKVIDFGLAKATGPRLTAQSVYTEVGNLIGTLEYMSPEQAELNNLDIDTRSDIYALGVILYELLTGVVPFSRKELAKADLAEMLRVIKETEPPKPSTKLSQSGTLPSIAAQRQMEPHKLTALVRGELDWIVMKALEKDRGRRYETANGFARDIQRYLADEPVEACPPSRAYRLRKFARKNRKALVTAGAFLVLLVAAAVVSTWLAIRAMHAEAAANTNAEQAQLNAEEAGRNAEQAREEAKAKESALQAERRAREDETKARRQGFDALRSMIDDFVERKFAQGEVLTDDDRAFLRGVITQYDAFAAIKGDDPESRALRAGGRFRVGFIRSTLGELQEAEQDYDQALSIFTQLAADFPKRPEFRQDLARTHNNRGLLLRNTGRLQEAEKDLDQALLIRKQLAADFPGRPEFQHDLASSYTNRGNVLREAGWLPEAEQYFGQALSIQKQLVANFPKRPEFRQDLARTHISRAANLLRNLDRAQDAEQDYNQAVSLLKQLAADFPFRPAFRQELAASHYGRAFVLSATGHRPEAEKDYDESLSISKQLAADFPNRPELRQKLADSYLNQGMHLSATDRRTEAEENYDLAVTILKQLAAEFPNQPEFRQDLARSHLVRGMLRSRTGRQPQAEQDYDQALSIQKQVAAQFPKQPKLQNDVAARCVNLALLQAQRGDLAAAKRLLLEGRPYHLAVLKVDPRNPDYRYFYRSHLSGLTAVHAGLLEQEDAVRTAETYRDVGWDPPGDAYAAALFLSRCIPIVAKHEKMDEKQRREAVQFYGDVAMKLLREAVSKGYKDVAHMKKDVDLGPLRPREDFQKLIAELEGKGK
jgi:serine/threonine protein kinase